MKTGYFTQQELIKLKLFLDKQQVDSKRLMKLILEDESSAFKQNMVSGKKYYAAEHDILNRQKYYYIEGKRETDVSKSNQKLPHPFLKVLIDQKTAYIVGNPIVVSVAVSDYEDPQKPTPAEEAAKKEAENFQELLLEQLGDSFDDKMNNWILNASKKALEWIHFYIDAEGELQFIIVPAEEIIPVYDTQYQNKLLQIIRYYKVEYYNSEDLEQKEKKYRYKVEIWTETGITYYAQYSDELELALDPDYKVNPAGHWTVLQTSPDLTVKRESGGWGRVPFVPLYNNAEGYTDLKPIKALIDAYDLVKSDWINDLEDFQELVYVVKNYAALTSEAQEGLSELAIFLQNVKTHKVISVEQDGGVETLKAEIPIEAKNKFLEITRREIFYFGEGVDIDNDKFGNNPTGISLKFLYASLDLKANRLIRKLKLSLASFMWFIVEFMNLQSKKKYDSAEILYTINKSVIFNEKEKIDGLVASEGMLSKRTILENHPLVDDVDEELKRLEQEEQDKVNSVAAGMFPVLPSPAAPDTGNEPNPSGEGE